MRWRKLGRVFETTGQRPWMQTHCSMPFAEAIGSNIFRIWFSPRDLHNRSHLAWLEIDVTRPQSVLRLAEKPVLAPGEDGCFDATGAMGSWLIRAGDKRRHYYIGWSRPGPEPYHVAIGLAVARGPGTEFIRQDDDNPILDRSASDPMMVSTPCVLQEGATWHMWYLSVTEWPDHTDSPRYDLRHATSIDGIAWRPESEPCISFVNPGECAIARPSVIRESDRWRMWFCHRGANYTYRIGYAESPDGATWTRDDTRAGIRASDSGWDSEMVAYPFVFDHGGDRYMLYAGNGYGRAGMGLAVLEQD